MKAKKYITLFDSILWPFLLLWTMATKKNNTPWSWVRTSEHQLYQKGIIAFKNGRENHSAIIHNKEAQKPKNIFDAFIKRNFSWKDVAIISVFDDLKDDRNFPDCNGSHHNDSEDYESIANRIRHLNGSKVNTDYFKTIFFLVKIDSKGNYWLSTRPFKRQVAITAGADSEEYFAFNQENRLLRLWVNEELCDKKSYHEKCLAGTKLI